MSVEGTCCGNFMRADRACPLLVPSPRLARGTTRGGRQREGLRRGGARARSASLRLRPSSFCGWRLPAAVVRTYLRLPLVKISQLETRIVAILKRRRPRPSVTRTAVTLTIVGSAGVSVAAAHPVPFDEAPVPTHEATLARAAAPSAEVRAPLEHELGVSAAVQPERPGPMRQEIQCPWAGSDSMRTMTVMGGLRVTGWNNGDRTIERSVAGMYLCMRAHGRVRDERRRHRGPSRGCRQLASARVQGRQDPTARDHRGPRRNRIRVEC